MLGGIKGYLVAMVACVVYRIDTAKKEVMIVIVEMSGDEIEDGAGENTGTRKIKVVGEFVERFDVVNAQLSSSLVALFLVEVAGRCRSPIPRRTQR